MVKSSIAKTPFKKWLKAACKTSEVFYQESRFIGNNDVMINLSVIENLDDLKPAIVEVFGHLEGDWKHMVDGEVEDINSFEFEQFGDLFEPVSDEDELMMINHSGFRTRRGVHVYDDLTLIPDSLHFIDFHDTFKDGRAVYMTSMNDGDKAVIMLIDSTYNLTGKDIDVDFVTKLQTAYDEANKDG